MRILNMFFLFFSIRRIYGWAAISILKLSGFFQRPISEPCTVPYGFLLYQPSGLCKRRKLERSHGPVGQNAHTFVGKASFWAVRVFLPQGAVSDSVNGVCSLYGLVRSDFEAAVSITRAILRGFSCSPSLF